MVGDPHPPEHARKGWVAGEGKCHRNHTADGSGAIPGSGKGEMVR